jgi:Integrase core domain
VILSVSRKGECWDNAVAESFFATIKRELINDRAWPTRAGLHGAVLDYIEGWYNTRRLHSALGYLSPAEYESATTTPPDRRHDQLKKPVCQSGSSPSPGLLRWTMVDLYGPANPSEKRKPGTAAKYSNLAQR